MTNDKELLNRFSFHDVSVENINKMADIRQRFYELALFLSSDVQNSRELSLALTKLEESMFWVNAGLARNG